MLIKNQGWASTGGMAAPGPFGRRCGYDKAAPEGKCLVDVLVITVLEEAGFTQMPVSVTSGGVIGFASERCGAGTESDF